MIYALIYFLASGSFCYGMIFVMNAREDKKMLLMEFVLCFVFGWFLTPGVLFTHYFKK